MFIRVSSYLCLGLVALVTLLYAVAGSRFAEISVQLSFLDFPVFVGELLMIFCVIVLIAHLFIDPVDWRAERGWRLWVLVYFTWVMVKTAQGYISGGPYALRNAALFYYPVFAILVEHFLGKVKIGYHKGLGLFSAIFLAVIFVVFPNVSLQYIFLILALCVAFGISHGGLRWGFVGFFVCLFLFRFVTLNNGRGCLLGVVAGIVFLVWYATRIMGFSLLRQLLLISIIGILFGMSLWIWGDRNAATSMITPGRIINSYRENDQIIKRQRNSFVPLKLQAQIYHKEEQPGDALLVPPVAVSVVAPLKEVECEPVPLASAPDMTQSSHQMSSPKLVITPSGEPSCEKVCQNETPDVQKHSPRSLRALAPAYGNAVFRLFIWRDMLKELLQERPLFGFSFGKPLRSTSIEIARIAYGEWSRDGWIMPHNSFLYFIYRGGIVGVAMIGFLVFSLVRMVQAFLRARSWQGGLLVSVLIFWIVNAQFGVILELPYNAVPFWAVFGVAWAYSHQLSARNKGEQC